MLETCYKKAVETLKICSTKNGFFASGGIDGYDAIWSRDSMISSLGASLVKEPLFKTTFKNSILTIKKDQSIHGQIPNCIDRFSKRKKKADFKTIDSSLWYILGNYIYKKRYNDNSIIKNNKKSIEKALRWLQFQDPGEIGMLAQLPTSDWQDAFPHKYGHTINTQALYYKVLNLLNKKKEAKKLKFLVNNNTEDGLWDKEFYLPYRWKNHNKYKEIGSWFDSLGNLLAINFNLADKSKALKILSYIKKKKIASPYPIKVIDPPIKPGDKGWREYFKDSDAGTPHQYANGGIWGYIGGFYILALIKYKKFNEAEKHLKNLAKANLKGNFPEWTHPKTKESYGNLQAWEAGMYILAYKSFLEKKPSFYLQLLFSYISYFLRNIFIIKTLNCMFPSIFTHFFS
jgi:glycogen debranching enzyme